jgi:hypothetical protein
MAGMRNYGNKTNKKKQQQVQSMTVLYEDVEYIYGCTFSVGYIYIYIELVIDVFYIFNSTVVD